MKITVDEIVKAKFPELQIFFKVIRKEAIVHILDDAVYNSAMLTDTEFADYQMFRKNIFGNTLLAVERLLQRAKRSLPKPDPLTSLIVEASYMTRLPLTIFCDDSFSTLTICFSKLGDAMKLDEHDEEIEPGLLVANTEQGILGILGTKSSSVGKLSCTSESLVILSFGCSIRTSKKSMKLVNQVTDRLLLQ